MQNKREGPQDPVRRGRWRGALLQAGFEPAIYATTLDDGNHYATLPPISYGRRGAVTWCESFVTCRQIWLNFIRTVVRHWWGPVTLEQLWVNREGEIHEGVHSLTVPRDFVWCKIQNLHNRVQLGTSVPAPTLDGRSVNRHGEITRRGPEDGAPGVGKPSLVRQTVSLVVP